MFLGDQFHSATEHLKVVDVRRVGADGGRERPLLRALVLVGAIEEGGDLRVLLKHPLVEMAGEQLAVFVEDRRGGFDDGDGLFGERMHVFDVAKPSK